MAISIGELLATIGADFSELDTALNDVDKKFKDVGKKLQSVGSKMSAAVTLPLLAVGAASVKMASDAEEAANKFDVVMGPAAERIRKELQNLHGVIPETQADLENMAAGIQDMLVPFGVAREEAAGMSLNMVQLAGDIASFNNVLPTEALAAMKSALAGSSEPMLRFGVDTRVASLEAIALREGLLKAGDEMSNTVRSQAVLIAIQEQSTDAMGDAARTVDSTANSMKFLARDAKELSITIGGILIPMVTPLIQRAKELLQRFQDLSPETQKKIVIMGALAAAIGPVLVVLGTMAVAIGALISPIGAVVVAVTALTTAWVIWGDDIKRITRETISAVGDWFGAKWDAIVGGFKKKVESIAAPFKKLYDIVVGNSIVPDMVREVSAEFVKMHGKTVMESEAMRAKVVDRFTKLSAGAKTATADMVEGVANQLIRLQNIAEETTTGVSVAVNQMAFQYSESGKQVFLESQRVRDEFERFGATAQKVASRGGDAMSTMADVMFTSFDKIGGKLGGLSDRFDGFINNLISKSGAFGDALGSIGQILGIAGPGGMVAGLAMNVLGPLVNKALSKAQEFIGNVGKRIGSFVSGLFGGGKSDAEKQQERLLLRGELRAERDQLQAARDAAAKAFDSATNPKEREEIMAMINSLDGAITALTHQANKIGGFAAGGFPGGGMAMIGERGAELVNFPRPGGRVFSHMQTQGMLTNAAMESGGMLSELRKLRGVEQSGFLQNNGLLEMVVRGQDEMNLRLRRVEEALA